MRFMLVWTGVFGLFIRIVRRFFFLAGPSVYSRIACLDGEMWEALLFEGFLIRGSIYDIVESKC